MRPPTDPGPLGTLPRPVPARLPGDARRDRRRGTDDLLGDHLERVEEAMRRALGAPGASLCPDPGYRRLARTLSEAADGGKRFRPALLAVAYRAWGGRDQDAAAGLAAAVELLHTAFVVHDDVIDADDTRRGRPSVLGAHTRAADALGVVPERAREYGVAAGILAGDLALTAAVRTVATCAVEREVVERLLDLFGTVLHVSAAGELADVWLGVGAGEPTVDAALLVAERKTAEYSFALPLQAAAVLAGARAGTVAAAGEVGRSLGTAYQLLDDLQGVFGDPASTGKSRLSDLRSGKQTALVAHARTTAAWPTVAPYVGLATLTEEEAAVVCDLLTASGSRAYVEALARGYVERAVAHARAAGMPAVLVSWLTGLTGDLLRGVA